eukprot:CAMPEP_0196572282 /NCGR_PEP_ID=MMETSP1081-20130531/2366_1 /TAXON_ID=36882 /ORGANISM="Pyramimonas amylifera, Strain CCMP720" /LENGTH=164 /DNA_ID=CAMNT_0041889555 /DNA_START=269 /DNA_END=763 /DNA_ORIENTATION=+
MPLLTTSCFSLSQLGIASKLSSVDRSIHASTSVQHKSEKEAEKGECISVTFIEADGVTEKTVQAPIGQNLLEVAHDNEIELEGACEGSLACSTCHVIVQDQEMFEKMPEADDDENDMLDLAFALTDTSRLGCQVIATKELDGLRVMLPSATRNFAVDGFKPKPH